MSVLIRIVNRDLLFALPAMVEFFYRSEGVGKVEVVDCGSTYPPLLEWYKSHPELTVYYEHNRGIKGAFEVPMIPQPEFYVATDSDLDFTGVPLDWVQVLRDGLLKYPNIIKTALALRLDGLPESPLTPMILDHQTPLWSTLVDNAWYEADTDTTVAMYRGGNGWIGYKPSYRHRPPYAVRHVPWYFTAESMPDDFRWYLRSTSDLSPTVYSKALRHLAGINPL